MVSRSGQLFCHLARRSDRPQPLWEYKDDPAGFVREVLGIRPLAYQVKIMESVRDNRSTAVASCHGAGKTMVAAMVVLWFFCTRKPAVVITTAPTGRQVKNLLWRYIRKLHAKAKRKLPGQVLSVEMKTDSLEDSDWWALGFASRDSNAAQGVHSENVLIVYDEATGVEDEIRESMEGALGDANARELALGNPTGDAGFFRDAWEKSKAFWHTINISALKTPNVRARKRLVPGLVGHEWVDKIRLRFGEKHPFWICRVLGRWFNFSDERCVTRQAIAAAQDRWETTPEGGERILAADVAAEGQDSTALVMRVGRRLWTVDVYHEGDPIENARRILDTAKRENADRIHVDATGVGLGVFSKLMELHAQGYCGDIEIVKIVWGWSARDKSTYNRLLDEIWFRVRWAFDPANPDCVAVDPDDTAMAEQLNLRRWRLDSRGKIKVETKNELRARGAGSPDVGDAAALAFFESETISVDFF